MGAEHQHVLATTTTVLLAYGMHRYHLADQARLEHAADQDILDDHLLALEQNEGRLAALDEKLAHWSTEEPYAEPVAWLRCFL